MPPPVLMVATERVFRDVLRPPFASGAAARTANGQVRDTGFPEEVGTTYD